MGVQILPPLEQSINCKNFYGHNFCILKISPLNFCKYANFDALFPSVVIDFPFLRLNQHFKIVKFDSSTLSLEDAV